MKNSFPPAFSSLPAVIALIVVSMVSCTKSIPAVADKSQTLVLPADGASVIDANNQFAFDLLRATLQQDTTANNKLVSPLSIYLALSMVYNGAGGATRDSMARALDLSGIDTNTLNSVCHALITQLPGEDNAVQLSIANSIWYAQNNYQPLASFLNTTQTDYDATIQSLNFKDPNSVNTINDWVAQKTDGKIPSVIKSISPDELMFLINAIYFNGAWQYAFKTSDTYNGEFHLQNGSAQTVPFMKQQVTVNAFIDSSFMMIELPYGGGKSYSMYIALPTDAQRSINSFASLMNGAVLANDIARMDSANLLVEIPKWEYSYSIDNMLPELSQLGMGIAFSDDADFSNLYNPNQTAVKLSRAIHKTYIKVDEQGTQAAAVTVIGVITAISAPPPPFLFRADHPFFYTIVEKQTGAILFTGIVNDPSAN